jgi:acyl-CoA-binding protein
MTDFVGRAKWDAWKQLQGMAGAKAMAAYIELIEGLK